VDSGPVAKHNMLGQAEQKTCGWCIFKKLL